METKKSNLSSVSIKQFKSYYVVWKRSKYLFFKFTSKKFKSYYVVWKPSFLFFLFCAIRCLNRTMQYGNIRVSPTFLVLSSFKSYYVVWKLLLHSFIKFYAGKFKSYYVVWKLISVLSSLTIVNCLNRTMQYGNFARKSKLSSAGGV